MLKFYLVKHKQKETTTSNALATSSSLAMAIVPYVPGPLIAIVGIAGMMAGL